jgi:hypothetical protein
VVRDTTTTAAAVTSTTTARKRSTAWSARRHATSIATMTGTTSTGHSVTVRSSVSPFTGTMRRRPDTQSGYPAN